MNSRRWLEDSGSPPAGGCFLRKGGHFQPKDVMLLRECDLFPRRVGSSMSVVVGDLDDESTWRGMGVAGERS